MLVAAVLRPEEREDGELEVVRAPPEQRTDALVLAVRQAEGSMERLFRNAAQSRQLNGAVRLPRRRTSAFHSSAAAAGSTASGTITASSSRVGATVPNGPWSEGT